MIADKLRTNIALFVMTNFAEPSKKSDIAWKPSEVLDLCGVLGALGRKFESPLPDWLFNEGQNPPWGKIGKNK